MHTKDNINTIPRFCFLKRVWPHKSTSPSWVRKFSIHIWHRNDLPRTKHYTVPKTRGKSCIRQTNTPQHPPDQSTTAFWLVKIGKSQSGVHRVKWTMSHIARAVSAHRTTYKFPPQNWGKASYDRPARSNSVNLTQELPLIGSFV